MSVSEMRSVEVRPTHPYTISEAVGMTKVIQNGHAVHLSDEHEAVTAPEDPPAICQDVEGGGWQATGRQGNASWIGWYPTRELAERALQRWLGGE